MGLWQAFRTASDENWRKRVGGTEPRQALEPILNWRRRTESYPKISPCPVVAQRATYQGGPSSPDDEEGQPAEERIVRFKDHDPDEDQDQCRRDDDRVEQRQALPSHVHEDRDDQAGLQDHEDQDQRPAQIADKAEIVDQVGAGAQNEQPSPYHQIELDRMMLRRNVGRHL